MADRAWELPAAGGSVLDQWPDTAAAVTPQLPHHVEAVAFHPETGQLDLRPDSPGYATQLRLITTRIVAAANEAAGTDVVRTVRVLPPSSAPAPPTSPAATPDAPQGPGRRPAPATTRRSPPTRPPGLTGTSTRPSRRRSSRRPAPCASSVGAPSPTRTPTTSPARSKLPGHSGAARPQPPKRQPCAGPEPNALRVRPGRRSRSRRQYSARREHAD